MAAKRPSRAEMKFFRALAQVAKESGTIVNRHKKGVKIDRPHVMEQDLLKYAKKIEKWATKQATELVAAVNRSDRRAFTNRSKMIARRLKSQVEETEIGDRAAQLIQEQTHLIQSIPVEMGFKVQEKAYQAFLVGARATPDPAVIRELEDSMDMTTEQAINRARLIARTETARATAAVNQARSEFLGATHYIWRTAQDGAVRESHREMNGRTFAFNHPPRLSDGTQGNPGTFPNCRCIAESILPDEDYEI